MILKNYFTLIFIAVFSFSFTANISSQIKPVIIDLGNKEKKNDPTYEEYFEITDCEFEPGAPAMYLLDEQESKVYIDHTKRQYFYSLKRHVKIKILTTEGLEYANLELLSINDKDDKFLNFKAITVNQENGEIVIEKVNKDDIIEEKIKKKSHIKKVVMPKVKVGSIIEYSYEKISPGISFIDDWKYQKEIPVLVSRMIFKNELNSSFAHFNYISTSFRISGNKSIEYSETYDSSLGIREVKNIPSFKKEEFALPVSEYIGKNVHLLSSIRDFTNLKTDTILIDYQDLNKLILEGKYFNYYLHKKNKILSNLNIDKTKDDFDNYEEYVKYIIKEIQNKIDWNEDDFFIPENTPKELLEFKTGNVADLNLLLIAALREAKLRAYPVLCSTRGHARLKNELPSYSDINYLICALELDGKFILLDATAKNLPFGKLPPRILNDKGWLIHKEKYQWIPLQTDDNIGKSTYFLKLKIEDDEIKGDFKTKIEGYSAYHHFEEEEKEGEGNKNDDDEDEEDDDNPLKDWSIEDVEIKKEKIDQPIITSSIISKEIEDEDMIYFNPIIIPPFKENPFTEEERISSIEFPYKTKFSYVLSLEIPEEYEVEEIPEELKISSFDKGIIYTFSAKKMSNKISVTSSFMINKTSHPRGYYPSIKEVFFKMIKKNEEFIILKKK